MQFQSIIHVILYIEKHSHIIYGGSFVNVAAEVIHSSWMLELHKSLHFMLPNHLSWNVQIPSDFSKCSISFPIEPVSLPHHQTLLGLQRIKLSKTKQNEALVISWSCEVKKLADAAVNVNACWWWDLLCGVATRYIKQNFWPV